MQESPSTNIPVNPQLSQPTMPAQPAQASVLDATAAIAITCPTCHVEVRPTDYFCYNCGHNLKPKPLSTSFMKQLLLYLGSVILPPFGLIWGWPYLREQTLKAKMIGVVTILLTVGSLVLSTYYAVQFANSINEQINQEMSKLQGFN